MSMYLINELQNITNPTEENIANAKYHAENGNVEAQYHLALIYDTGNGITRNPKEAEKWYKQAAIAGHAGAQYYLSRLYSTKNSGIKNDQKEADKWLKAAINNGFKIVRNS